MSRRLFPRKLIQRLKKVDQEQLERLLGRLVDEKDLVDLVLETIAEGVLVTDDRNRILLINVGLRSLLGLGDESWIGRPLREAVEDEGLWTTIVGNASIMSETEVRVVRPREMWIEVKCLPLWEGRERLLGKLHVFRDVTEKRHQQASHSREQRIASLGALAAGLAHEIRNPLNALSIHVQLARRRLESEKRLKKAFLSEELAIVSATVANLESIVRQFLSAARPRKIDRRARDIHAVLDLSLALLWPELDSRGISLEKSYDVNVPSLLIDAVQMQEVVTNLVRNAAQAMPHGGRLSIRTLRGGDGVIRLEFEDTGEGIPEEILPRIFDPYFTTKEDGTGLGLFLVHRIVTDHCGMIEVDSRLGQGTQISVLLPRDLCEAKFLPETTPC